MSRADDLKAKAERLRASAARVVEPQVKPQVKPEVSRSVDTEVSNSVDTEVSNSVSQSRPPVLPSTVRSKPVRLTVDVAPTEHAELARLGLEAAASLGTARVAGQELVRALLRRYLADADLQRQVLADVADHRRRNRLR